jgi:hypothetical protein
MIFIIQNIHTIKVKPPTAQFNWSSVANNYPEVTAAAWQPGPPGHNVEHIIETTGPPVTAKFMQFDL